MSQMKKITEDHIAAYLASNPRKARRAKLLKDDPKECSEHFLRQFSAENLFRALHDGNESINVDWIVQKYLHIYQDSPRDRISILERLLSFIRIGAVQNEDFINQINGLAKKKTMSDPFSNLKFKDGTNT